MTVRCHTYLKAPPVLAVLFVRPIERRLSANMVFAFNVSFGGDLEQLRWQYIYTLALTIYVSVYLAPVFVGSPS